MLITLDAIFVHANLGEGKDTPLSQPTKNELKIHIDYHKLLSLKSNIIEINGNNLVTFNLVALRTYIRHLHTVLPTIQSPCVNIS